MPPLAWEWSRRIHWGPGRLVSLDWGKELWDWHVSHYESADGITRALAREGRQVDEESVLSDATSTLLPDVVDAAGGIEHSLFDLTAAMERAQAVYDNLPGDLKERDLPPQGMGLNDPSLEDAWYSLEELIVWARVLDDRLKRKAVDRRYPPQGLIPALSDGARKDAIIEARSKLLNTGVREARYLAGLNLHMQPMHAGSKGGRIRARQVVLPFPDAVECPISHRWELTYLAGRDGVSFARALFAGVVRFMDDVLSALELHLPERFRNVE